MASEKISSKRNYSRFEQRESEGNRAKYVVNFVLQFNENAFNQRACR